jgi:hypothetical protein
MRNLSIYFLLIIFSLGMNALSAAENSAIVEQRKKANVEIERFVEYDTVIENLKKWNLDIERSRKKIKPLLAIRYSSFCGRVQTWLKYEWFTADSGLSKVWLKKVYDLLAYMKKTKGLMEVDEFNGKTDTAKYKKALEYFSVALSRYQKLISKPEKVSMEYQRKARMKKAAWQKLMRKKYNIKD